MTLGITWQPPIIASFYNGVKLLLKEDSQRQQEPNEGRAPPHTHPLAGWGLFVQAAVRPHWRGHIVVIHLKLLTASIKLRDMSNFLGNQPEQTSRKCPGGHFGGGVFWERRLFQ